ncbi:hypothetical protein AWH04_03530 [Rhodococcus erythropolis]|nr:hypothetical protein AWH04_03530 [Rhodococcus erythropolis]
MQSLGELDDRAERYFLELKSEVDLSTTGGGAKVAKFILGAANRNPDVAAKRFGGHALMVLGISEGAVTGIPFFEAKDLENTVKKYIGDDGPHWDFERVRVGGDRDVITIVVDPPRHGDPVFTCHKDGPENLKDGGIYIRLDGQTREAKGGEVRALLTRAQSARPQADLEVSVVGSALPFHCDAEVLEEYITDIRGELESAYRNHVLKSAAPQPLSAAFRDLNSGAFGVEPEDRSPEEYRVEIDHWEAEVREAWTALLDDVAAAVWPCARIRVRNLRKTFLEGVVVKIHLEGPVRAIAKMPDSGDLLRSLPARPRPWGPRTTTPLFGGPDLAHHFRYEPPVPAAIYDSVGFENSGSVDLRLHLSELRPEDTYDSDDGEFVLFLRDLDVRHIAGVWKVTAREHHELYQGELTVDVAEPRDFSEGLRSILNDDETDEDDMSEATDDR